jgi:hypothetical protein
VVAAAQAAAAMIAVSHTVGVFKVWHLDISAAGRFFTSDKQQQRLQLQQQRKQQPPLQYFTLRHVQHWPCRIIAVPQGLSQ